MFELKVHRDDKDLSAPYRLQIMLRIDMIFVKRTQPSNTATVIQQHRTLIWKKLHFFPLSGKNYQKLSDQEENYWQQISKHENSSRSRIVRMKVTIGNRPPCMRTVLDKGIKDREDEGDYWQLNSKHENSSRSRIVRMKVTIGNRPPIMRTVIDKRTKDWEDEGVLTIK